MNKHKLTGWVFRWALVLAGPLSYGQSGLSPASSLSVLDKQVSSNTNPLSPQSYDFVNYGNTPVAFFTGGIDLKVPLYTYQDKDFELPLFLGYNSSGFIPNKREGIVGLNWFLNNGSGVITRSINGVADERQGGGLNVTETTLHGFLYGIRNSAKLKATSNSGIFANPTADVSPEFYWHIDACEFQPDEFTFSMPGYNGKFFFQNDGTVRVESNKPLKVDISKLATQTVNSYFEVKDSEISLTTDNGYTYYFGGTVQFLEFSALMINGGNTAPEINAWHLSRIVAPNGRVATFQYTAFASNPGTTYQKSTSDHILYSLTNFYSGETANLLIGGNGGVFSLDGSSASGSAGPTTQQEMTKTIYLESITVDQKKIEFGYRTKVKNFYTGVSGLPTDGGITFGDRGLQLDNIVVKDNGTALYRYQFGYQYQGGQGVNSRQLLTSLTEPGKNPYLFTYYLPASGFPDPQTSSLDYWGFWKGGYSLVQNSLLPGGSIDANADLTYTTDEREPNASFANTGLLKTITYPTNGYTQFEYEGHAYAQRLERRNASKFLPQLFGVTGTAGGARIAKITDFDKGGAIGRTREYKYVEKFATGGTTSSGILLSWPRYYYVWKFSGGGVLQNILQMKSSSYHVNHDPGESFIQYGEVTEVVSPANGCTTYQFTDYESNPDVNDFRTFVTIPETQQYITNLDLYNNFVGLNFNNRSFERGQPKEVTTYAYQNNAYYPLQKTITDYTSLASYPDYYVTEVHPTGGLVQSTKKYYYPFLPLKETVLTYSNQGQQSVSTITNTTYTAENYPRTRSTTQSDGKVPQVKYKYVNDYLSPELKTFYRASTTNFNGLSPEVRALVNLGENNVLNRPVEVITSVDGKVTGATLLTYQDIGNAYRSNLNYAYQQWGLKTKTELATFTESALTSNTWVFTKHAAYGTTPDLTLKKYDAKGNVTEQTDRSGISTAIVWGYNYTYPVAVIQNAAYSEVQAILSATTLAQLNTLPGTEQQVRQTLQPLRDAVALKNARITTYTYAPLIGMKSTTDVNGVTTYYQYDALNRFRLLLDKDQNILKRYEYNYQAR